MQLNFAGRVSQDARPLFVLHQGMSPEESVGRVDKWLWTVRLFRTRSLASDACRAGSVVINQLPVKPARAVRAGETIEVRQGVVRRTLRVVGVPPARVGAKLVAQFCDDLTPPEEFAKAREARLQHVLAREKGSGRPTKKDRRLRDKFFG